MSRLSTEEIIALYKTPSMSAPPKPAVLSPYEQQEKANRIAEEVRAWARPKQKMITYTASTQCVTPCPKCRGIRTVMSAKGLFCVDCGKNTSPAVKAATTRAPAPRHQHIADPGQQWCTRCKYLNLRYREKMWHCPRCSASGPRWP